MGGRGRGVSNLPAWMRQKQAGTDEQPPSTDRDKPTESTSAPPVARAEPRPEPAKKKKGAFGKPTTVLLLKNMVAPGDVDDDLSRETHLECEKYGAVKQCVIFEVTERSVAPEEAVRTFVAFEKQESALKAFLDLEGRFFAGRKISCAFY